MDNNQFNPNEMKKKFDSSIKDPKNLAIYIALAVVIISVFLPFLKMDIFGISESVSLMSGGKGIFYIVLALGIAASRLFGKILPQAITTALLTLLFLYDFFTSTSTELGDLIKLALGAYLMLIAVAVVAAITVIQFLASKKNS